MANHIIIAKFKIIFRLYQQGVIKVRAIARELYTSRNTVKIYVSQIRHITALHPEQTSNVDFYITKIFHPKKPIRSLHLLDLFPSIYFNIDNGNSNRIKEWQNYKSAFPEGYNYSQFNHHFIKWCADNGKRINPNKCFNLRLTEEEKHMLNKWRKAADKRKWEKAVIISEAIAQKIERTPEKVRDWIRVFKEDGLKGFVKKPRKQNEAVILQVQEKKANLIKLIHETPKLHDINRTSWSIKTLAEAYKKTYGTSISISSISEYIRAEGYSFKKARETLTSPDPLFREKLKYITDILSNLSLKEKFFSIDEYGPFAVKIKGGRTLVKKGEEKTYPQLQKSKGCIICTAALELSTNQVIHFYSTQKNTGEMIKLLFVLLERYKGEDKIYFSWDAASWHASKKLYQVVKEVNSDEYRKGHQSPLVELAPLPVSAQFLNIIESVFSGLAKAVIHSSDYQSVGECKAAIDRHFKERKE
jgi:transposase